MKRWISIFLCLIWLLSLCACGKSQSASLSTPMTQAETDLQTLSQNASITASLPENMYISAVGIQGQQVYISASQTGGDGTDTAGYVYVVDRDTGALNLLYQQMSSIIQICPLEDETLWLATWNYDQDTGTASSALLHVDAAGQELARIDIQSLVGAEDNYINYLLPDTGGAVVAFVGGHLMALNSQGNITAAMDMTDSSCSDLTILSTGEIMGVFRQIDAVGNVGDSCIAQVDLTAQTVTPWNMGDDIDWGLYPQILCDDGNTLWISHDDVVCTYDRASGLAQEQFTWVSAGVNAIQMLGTFLDDDGTLWAVSSSQAGDSITIFPVQTADSGRKTLTLATMFLSYTARLAVTAFNQENPDYCIEVKEYLSSGGNINDSLEQFAYDVMSGDVPDIVDLSEMDYDSLLQKGLLLDLTPYIDGENGLDRSEYLESVFDANTDETGAMYSLIPHFSISTLAGDASVFGSAQGCTLEQLEQAAQTCADMGMVLFSCASRKDVLYYLLPNISLENYMDRTTNTCSFNSQEFVDLLNFAATVPLSEVNYYNEYDYSLTSVAAVDIFNFQSYSDLQNYGEGDIQENLGENFTLLGYPDAKTLFSLSPTEEYAIFATTDEPEACWAFLRTFCEEYYQSGCDYEYLNGFPILNSC